MNAALRRFPVITSSFALDERAGLDTSFERIAKTVPTGAGWARCEHRQFTLSSHFQPIFSVADERCVAYEALLTARGGNGQASNPQTVFALAEQEGDSLFLDWLCRGLHLRNFANVDRGDALLFINAYPEAAIEDPHHPDVFRRLLEAYDVPAERVVIEILETGVSDETKLSDAVELYRSLGCKIAIDDFGIGYSNFDRLWRLKPDFVKIDRSVNASAVRDAHARRVMINTVNLIHECGAKVVVEGIESRDEALLALESGADFVQGYYFARPGLAAVPAGLCGAMFKSLYADYLVRQQWRLTAENANDLDVFSHALNLCVRDLVNGMSFHRATEKFRSLPTVLRVYLATSELAGRDADEHERVVVDLIDTRSFESARWSGDCTTSPLSAMRNVLNAALAAPQQVHVFRAVEATHARGRAVTLSCAFELEGRMVVLVGEVVDRRRHAPRARGGSALSDTGSHVVSTLPLY
ncbi:MAG: EAL domain-containing protein [Betaproteobacteria bacterium]|nr:EAL domain-containing protein [Betaproteobacteria bacterium]